MKELDFEEQQAKLETIRARRKEQGHVRMSWADADIEFLLQLVDQQIKEIQALIDGDHETNSSDTTASDGV